MQKINPDPSKVRDRTYITYRRLWLDSMLDAFTPNMHGIVVDLGGKRKRKRGYFQAPEHQAQAWWYINLDWETAPNIFADVTQVPIAGQYTDCIICTEVLEHLPNPQSCVDEIYRLLRSNGIAFVSVPFFYPVHADPFDCQRFTDDGLRHLFRDFKSVDVIRMGGYAGVLGLILELGAAGIAGDTFLQKLVSWMMRRSSRWMCSYDLSVNAYESPAWSKFTTGYFVRAVR